MISSRLLHPGVAEKLLDLNAKFEDRVHYPYLDIRGYVTVGIGCLIDPFHLAKDLPWEIQGRPATADEVEYYWRIVKAMPPKMRAYRYETSLRLSDSAVDQLFFRRLNIMVDYLSNLFGNVATWPADGQVAVLLLAWYTGVGFDLAPADGGRPAVLRALEADDWVSFKAAALTALDVDQNPGLAPREKAVAICSDNATVTEGPSLVYPGHLMPPRAKPRQRTLRLDDRGPDVADLKKHLHYGASDYSEELFDERLDRGLRPLQASHGLIGDGIVGPKTRRAIQWRVGE